MDNQKNHEHYMRLALKEAERALGEDEVPVGAVIVHQGRVIGKAHNQKERLRDPTAHAEMIAITQAAADLENWRLEGCTMYVTVEPCAMCAGAMVQTRLENLVYGAKEDKSGACGSIIDILDQDKFNHQVKVTGGVLAEECKKILQEFFEERCRSGRTGRSRKPLVA